MQRLLRHQRSRTQHNRRRQNHLRRHRHRPRRGYMTFIAGSSIVSAGLWLSSNYMVCKPNQVLVRTGMFIDDMKVNKAALRLPFQSAMKVDLNPTTYKFRLHNMSKGKVEFELPVVLTIGPKLPEDDYEAFTRYCKLLQDMESKDIEQTVQGIIEGETRGLTAQMTVEEIFNGKEVFRRQVENQLKPDLMELGLKIYNANIQEMKDFDENNKYFEYRKQRAIEMANNEARRDVAEAQKQGDVAVSERSRDTRMALANNEKEARVEEYARQQEMLIAEAEVAKQESETKQIRDVTMMRALQAVEIKKQELQREIEEKRFEQAMQAQKSEILAPALAEAESQERLADAHLYQKRKEAEGIQSLMEAQAEGVNRLMTSCNGNEDLAKFYLGNERGLWHKVAEESANAVQGMQPQITQWHTGGGGGNSSNNNNNVSNTVVDLIQGVVPLYQEVKKHLHKETEINQLN